MSLKCNIKLIRWEKQISQQEISDKTGISTSQLSQYEAGKVYPNAVNLWRIARALSCPVDDLYEEID